MPVKTPDQQRYATGSRPDRQRKRLRPGSPCQYNAQRIRGLQSARPYRYLHSYILQCFLGNKLPACVHCLKMKGIRYLPRTTPLRCLSAALRQVGGPKEWRCLLSRYLSPLRTLCVVLSMGLTCGRWLALVASPSWKPHRNQWQLVTRESVIKIETAIGQQLPTSSKLSGRSNLWIMGLVVSVMWLKVHSPVVRNYYRVCMLEIVLKLFFMRLLGVVFYSRSIALSLTNLKESFHKYLM